MCEETKLEEEENLVRTSSTQSMLRRLSALWAPCHDPPSSRRATDGDYLVMGLADPHQPDGCNLQVTLGHSSRCYSVDAICLYDSGV